MLFSFILALSITISLCIYQAGLRNIVEEAPAELHRAISGDLVAEEDTEQAAEGIIRVGTEVYK